MDYTEPLLWFSLWPIVIFVGYKIVALNVKKFEEIK